MGKKSIACSRVPSPSPSPRWTMEHGKRAGKKTGRKTQPKSNVLSFKQSGHVVSKKWIKILITTRTDSCLLGPFYMHGYVCHYEYSLLCIATYSLYIVQ